MKVAIGLGVGYSSNSYNKGGGFLLDKYSGAVAAYSLRQLSKDTTNVVRVRRSSDNAEQDFSANEITDGTLTTWVGVGNDGFVTTWYDQSGNGNDATQATAANQPKIVNAGSLVTENGLPALDFDGLNDYLQSIRLITSNNWFISHVYSTTSTILYQALTTQHTGAPANSRVTFAQLNLPTNNAEIGLFFNNGTSYPGTHSIGGTTNITLLSSLAYANDYYLSVNGNIEEVVSNQALTPLNVAFRIGVQGTLFNLFSGTMQEVIVYNSDQSSNRTGIETNINNFYSIY